MTVVDSSSNERYLLFLDILGFSELVESRETEEIYTVIDNALNAFDHWERLNGLFKTIYFSDTFIFYQESSNYAKWAFLDIYAIGGMILSALLAKGIPARGSIVFGEFIVRQGNADRRQVYFGKALLEAYKAEQREKWIGISILPSAWRPFDAENPGIVDAFASERAWAKRVDDEVLMLNPFIKLRGWHELATIGEVDKPFSKWDSPEFPNEILAFKFLRDTAADFARRNDFSSPAASKYHVTICFLKEVLGPELFQWGIDASLPANFN